MDEENWKLRIYSEHKNRHENNPFDIDQWYPVLKSITFKTFFLPLQFQEAIAIMHYYRQRYLYRLELTYIDIYTLTNLEKKIQNFLNSNPILKSSAFFRLCGRSPKDGDPYSSKKVREDYYSNLEKVSKFYNLDKNDPQTKVLAISRTNLLKITNAKEVMSLLLSSERVYNDMFDWTQDGGKEQIVFREFSDKLFYDYEFRGYVYNNKLCAITQYDHYGCYQHIINNKEKFEKMINEFWNNKVKNLMIKVTKNYVVDFCIIDEKDVILIELSPFMRCTGASCYRWEKDSKEMMNGNGKLKVNLVKDRNDIDYLTKNWIKKFNYDDDFYDEFYVIVNESWSGMFWRYLWNIGLYKEKIEYYYILIVSVLKKGFFWNYKYFDENCELIENVCVEDLKINVDKNGMGWIEEEKGKKLKGEIWKVNKYQLNDIKYFYGIIIEKEKEIKCKNEIINVKYYIRKYKPKNIEKEIELEEYTIDIQNKYYNNIGHNLTLQEKYLKYPQVFPN
jgi:hypothetical protein